MAFEINPKAKENDIVVQELKSEVLLYDLTINKAYCLNETSAAIWNLCDGNNSVSDITKQLSKQLKQPVTDDLVWFALDQFKQDNLLADNEQVEIKFDGLSRREVIRKVGFASMIALPVISSLIAPTAAMAQSGACRQLGETCTPRSTAPGQNNCCANDFCSSSGDCNSCYASGSSVVGCSDPTFLICGPYCQSEGFACCSGNINAVPNTSLGFDCICT